MYPPSQAAIMYRNAPKILITYVGDWTRNVAMQLLTVTFHAHVIMYMQQTYPTTTLVSVILYGVGVGGLSIPKAVILLRNIGPI